MRIESARGFILEHAVSGRARCRVCREKIDKDDPRFGAGDDLVSSRIEWFHPRCVKRNLLDLAELLERWTEPVPGGARLLDRLRKGYVGTEVLPPDELVSTAQAGDWDTTSEALRRLWWTTRDPAVARVAADLQRFLLAETPVSQSDLHRQWKTLDPTDAVQAGRRIVVAGRLPKNQLDSALAHACTEAPDPGWIELVLPWFAQPPYSNALYLWHTVLQLFDQLADPRVLDVARAQMELHHAVRSRRLGMATSRELDHWMTTRLAHGYPRVTRPERTLTEPERDALGRVRAALERRSDGAEREERDRGTLLHAAAAGDDGALLVYADVLLSRGDIRGEFIQLERVGSKRTPAQRERRKKLKKAWRDLLGDLGPVLLKDGLTWRRGLIVTAAAVPCRPTDLEAVLTSIDWASMERLELRRNARNDFEPRLAFPTHAQRLTSLVLPDTSAFMRVLDSEGVAHRVREIEIVSNDVDFLYGHALFEWAHAFPTLERIIAPSGCSTCSADTWSAWS